MKWFFTAYLLLPLVSVLTWADPPGESIPRVKPLEPADAVRSFDVQPGFHVELVASEPLIRSPVDLAFDADGRLFVVEYPEYNQATNIQFKGKGCVKLLHDDNGDGRFDRATAYVDQLEGPTCVACWDGGIFVGAAPDLWYFKDTRGDGKVDVRRKVLSGFDRDRAGEAMLNSLRWTLDNKLHICTGLVGGNIAAGDGRPVNVRKQDIRLDPRTGTFTLTSGGGQYGYTFDDWGNAFTCENSYPVQQFMYDAAYLARNPFVEAPAPLANAHSAGRYPGLHRVSPPEPWRAVRTKMITDGTFIQGSEGPVPFGYFTAATGVTVYRGDAFPPAYRGNIFLGEVANNLIYRAIPRPAGLGWMADRADPSREFAASRDVWHRPAQFANAPDGTLYFADMYRELIEGAQFLPPKLLEHVSVAGGLDRGRIYRVVPDGVKLRPAPQLSRASTAELVGSLQHENGWHRDTAAALLYARQDRSAVPPLRTLANSAPAALTRLHALYALQGLNSLAASDLIEALDAGDARLRVHAIRLAEPFARDPALAGRMAQLADDPEPRMRYQLAFSLASLPADMAVAPLAKLARGAGEDRWQRLAVLTSAGQCAGPLLARLLAEPGYRATKSGRSLIVALAGQIAAARRPADVEALARSVDALPPAERPLAGDLVRTAALKRTRLPGALAAGIVTEIVADAKASAANATATSEVRTAALATLTLATLTESRDILTGCLSAQQPPAVAAAALNALTNYDDPAVPAIVLGAWPGLSPALRATATETLLARPTWVKHLLDAVERGTVKPSEIDPARIDLLKRSADAAVRQRATALFAASGLSSRKDVIAKYSPALTRRGNPAKGKLVFKDACSTCHRLENVGTEVGPDLRSIRARGLEAVLINILDPNRDVLPKYLAYTITTDAGVAHTGMITAETANSVTIRKADGTVVTIPRPNIESLNSTGLSAMPEGIERQVDVDAMADLLAYLDGLR